MASFGPPKLASTDWDDEWGRELSKLRRALGAQQNQDALAQHNRDSTAQSQVSSRDSSRLPQAVPRRTTSWGDNGILLSDTSRSTSEEKVLSTKADGAGSRYTRLTAATPETSPTNPSVDVGRPRESVPGPALASQWTVPRTATGKRVIRISLTRRPRRTPKRSGSGRCRCRKSRC